MKRHYENFTVDEGTDANGVRTRLYYEGDSLTVHKTYDAEPHLLRAKQMREAQEGQRWGNGKWVAHIPPVEYARFLAIKDANDRRKAIKQWLRDNDQFVGYRPYLMR